MTSSFAPQDLTFTTVEAERQRLLDYCRNSKKLLILDLKAITAFDSAGLAFLIEFKRLARKYKQQSRIEGITEPISALAAFYGITVLLNPDK